MKILFYQWDSFLNKGIERAFKELEIEYEVFFYRLNDWEKDEIFVEQFTKAVKNSSYRIIFSVNFVPLISYICKQYGLPYISWVYDSPVHIRDLSSMKHDCNTIYFFDRGQAECYSKLGIPARHMPLAASNDVFCKTMPSGGQQNFAADISFVGKLYQTEYRYYTGGLPEYYRGYLEGMINAQQKIPVGYIMDELVADEQIAEISDIMGKRELEFMLSSEITGRDRYLALALLSAHFEVALYSTDQCTELERIKERGYVDYYTQMPQVFIQSKINLNISLKTIRTGIPLRILDIIACNGFVLTNFQLELAEYFQIGEEIIVYENLEDLYQKAKFYLRHDSSRMKVIEKGVARIQRDFTFADRIKRMKLI